MNPSNPEMKLLYVTPEKVYMYVHTEHTWTWYIAMR